MAASVSRRTLWVSGALCALPCLSCLATFRIEFLSCVSLFLFLPAAILGVRRGLGIAPIKLSFAITAGTGDNHIDASHVERRRFTERSVGRSYGRHGTSSLRRTNLATEPNRPETTKQREVQRDDVNTNTLSLECLTLAFGFAFLSAVPAFSDSAKSQVVERQLRSENIAQNKTGSDPLRNMLVYLPPVMTSPQSSGIR